MREGVQLPERLAAGVPEGGARPGQERGSLPLLLLLPGQQAAVYQPLGANGQLGVNVALAQRHHAGSCGHKENNSSVKRRRKQLGCVVGDKGKADREARGDATDLINSIKQGEARLQLG